MQFSQLRKTLIKRIHTPEDNDFTRVNEDGKEETWFNPSTPRWVSPFRGNTQKLRVGIDIDDVQTPASNRASRRSIKVKKERIRGVSVRKEWQPWKK